MKNFEKRWSSTAAIPLAIAGLIYLVAYSVQVLAPEKSEISLAAEILSWVIWGIYAVDLIIRFLGRDNLGQFMKSNWLEILALTIPFLRFLRAFRVVLAIRGLSGVLNSRLQATGVYLATVVPLAWYAGALAIYDVEHQLAGTTFSSFKDAMWWSLSTIVTVGYGDIFPISDEGRFIGGALMLSGVALFSAAAGIFATWLSSSVKISK